MGEKTEIKMIAMDLDHTLLEENLEIGPEALEALHAAAEKGIVLALATGRIFLSAVQYAAQLGSDTKIVCYNGGLIAEPDGTPIYEAALDVETLREIIAFTRENGLYCQFYENHCIVVEEVNEGTTIDPDLKNTRAIETGNFDTYDLKPSPKSLVVAPPADVPRYQAMLRQRLGGKVYVAQSQPYLIEIMPAGVHKAASLTRLCDILGILPEEVMACGDNTNDAEMVEWAGVGVAVGNAVDALKAKANYVCQETRSRGVAEAVRKYCLEP